MLRRPHFIILGVIILVTVVILKLPSRTAIQLKLAISSLFMPLDGLSSSAKHLTEKAGNALVPRAELVRQMEELRQENQELKVRAAEAEEIGRENARLRQYFNFAKRDRLKLKLA